MPFKFSGGPVSPDCPECGQPMKPELPYPGAKRFTYVCFAIKHGRRTPLYQPDDVNVILAAFANEQGRQRHSKGTIRGAE